MTLEHCVTLASCLGLYPVLTASWPSSKSGLIVFVGDLGSGEILLELTSWFNAYLNYTERPARRLRLLEDYLTFWMELPHLFECFLRRR